MAGTWTRDVRIRANFFISFFFFFATRRFATWRLNRVHEVKRG